MITITKNFSHFKSTKKGTIGEFLVIDIIKKMFPQYDILTHHIKNKAHWVDFVIMNKEKNDVKYIEVKTKARFNKYPITGIDLRHYKEYIKLYEKGNDVIIIFVDDKIGDIHFLPVSKAIELENQDKIKRFSFKQKNKKTETICWYLSDMKFISKITEKYINNLTRYDERNYIFKIENI